jgi:hypothetical protein
MHWAPESLQSNNILVRHANELVVVPFSVMSSRITRVSRLRLRARCMAHREGWSSQCPDDLTRFTSNPIVFLSIAESL